MAQAYTIPFVHERHYTRGPSLVSTEVRNNVSLAGVWSQEWIAGWLGERAKDPEGGHCGFADNAVRVDNPGIICATIVPAYYDNSNYR